MWLGRATGFRRHPFREDGGGKDANIKQAREEKEEKDSGKCLLVGRKKDSMKQEWKNTRDRKEFQEAGPLCHVR